MIQLITTEIELSQDDIKEAITDWLYNKDIINSEMKIDFGIINQNIHTKPQK